jgi:hypothetical protein
MYCRLDSGGPELCGPGLGARAAADGPRTKPIGSASLDRTPRGRVRPDPPAPALGCGWPKMDRPVQKKMYCLLDSGGSEHCGPGLGARDTAAGPRTKPIASAASGRTPTGRVRPDPPAPALGCGWPKMGRPAQKKCTALLDSGDPELWVLGLGARAAAAGPRTTPIASAASGRTPRGQLTPDPPAPALGCGWSESGRPAQKSLYGPPGQWWPQPLWPWSRGSGRGGWPSDHADQGGRID